MKITALFTINVFLVLLGCAYSSPDTDEETRVDFGSLKTIKSDEIISDYEYIQLESSKTSLLGAINQVEVYNDHIYILDKNRTNTIFVFSKEGKFISKLEAKGNGPGEFIAPNSFKIDKKGNIYILDRSLNKLLKYNSDNFKFVESILLPEPSPLSFSIIEDKCLFIYYYPLREKNKLNNKQIVIADKTGKIIQTLLDATPSSKILHGNSDNFYLYKEHLRMYPYFSNKIYELTNDSLINCYNLYWGGLTMPNEDLFIKSNNSGDIMKEILTDSANWIRLIYVYETEETLLLKYYIKQDFYLSYWNKLTNKVINTKVKNIIDNLDMGNCFPLPIGVYGEKIIGVINPFDITPEKIKDEKLLKLLENTDEESNPILVLYQLK